VTKQPFRVLNNTIACPSCGNQVDFEATSFRCAEDCCEMHIQCKCGHERRPDGYEDVWGSLTEEIIKVLFYELWARGQG